MDFELFFTNQLDMYVFWIEPLMLKIMLRLYDTLLL
jgi:hypothetical protein